MRLILNKIALCVLFLTSIGCFTAIGVLYTRQTLSDVSTQSDDPFVWVVKVDFGNDIVFSSKQSQLLVLKEYMPSVKPQLATFSQSRVVRKRIDLGLELIEKSLSDSTSVLDVDLPNFVDRSFVDTVHIDQYRSSVGKLGDIVSFEYTRNTGEKIGIAHYEIVSLANLYVYILQGGEPTNLKLKYYTLEEFNLYGTIYLFTKLNFDEIYSNFYIIKHFAK